MAGTGMTLSIAIQALRSQQYAISVTGQNVANVDNENYTRQTVTMSNGGSVKIRGNIFGNGVSISAVKSIADSYLESSLSDKKSTLASYEELELYMSSIENIISSNSDSDLSGLLSEYWNAWSDLSNNPEGYSERVLVYEYGSLLAEQVNSMYEALQDVAVSVQSEIGSAVNEVNYLCTEISVLNLDIVSLEASGATANDLRDQRSALLSELTDLIGCTTFESSDGSVSVMTAEGYPLVSDGSTHTLSYSSGRIYWEGSAGTVDITDEISGGRLDGWLTIRDELIPEYQAELDSFAEELIYNVNLVYSQGVGENYFSEALTSYYETDSSGLLSTLDYADRIDTSTDLVIWIEDASGSTSVYTPVSVDLSGADPVSSTTFDLTGTANDINGNYIFTIDPPTGSIGGASDVTVTWTSDTATGSFTVAAGDLTTEYDVDGMTFSLSAVSGPYTGGNFTVTTDSRGVPSENISSYTLSDLATDINAAVTAAGGGVAATVSDGHLVFTPDSDDYAFAFSNDDGDESGLLAALGLNTFFTGNDAASISVNEFLSDGNYINFARIDQDTGEIASGDNSNALLMADLQDSEFEAQNWTFTRGEAAVSSLIEETSSEIYQSLVSSVGSKTQVVSIQVENYTEIVAALQEQRDTVSAVSLDEEMINLTKYQTAYEAASKLLTVVDEMLSTLLAIR